MIWTGFDRVGTQAMQFVIGIIIARILMPSDYGIIGMLGIFMAIAATFMDSGFSSALIQKKGKKPQDYSTAFYFNLAVSALFYAILYICAPAIARFYEQPLLTDVLRVYALTLIVNALSTVQTARLSIELNFRLQAAASVASTLLSGVLGIWMAYSGFGVWALVYQSIASSSVKAVVLWLMSGWKPSMSFSVESFKGLFSYGSRILASNIINTVYDNIYTIIIGKIFTPAQVGYYNRANQFAQAPSSTISGTVLKVNFPVLAKLQDDDEALLKAYRQFLRMAIYILYPFLFGLAVVAEPLIAVILGEKWLPAVPYLRILCLGFLFAPLTDINLNLLYVKGRTDLVLKLELIKKPVAFLILAAFCPFGILWLCASRALYSIVAFCINCHYTKKLLGYGIWPQVKEILPILLYCILMSAIVLVVLAMAQNPVVQCTAGIIAGIVSYTGVSVAFREETFSKILGIIKGRARK